MGTTVEEKWVDVEGLRIHIEYFIRILGRLMDALELEKASLVGISMGGGIALGFTLRRPGG